MFFLKTKQIFKIWNNFLNKYFSSTIFTDMNIFYMKISFICPIILVETPINQKRRANQSFFWLNKKPNKWHIFKYLFGNENKLISVLNLKSTKFIRFFSGFLCVVDNHKLYHMQKIICNKLSWNNWIVGIKSKYIFHFILLERTGEETDYHHHY